MFSLTILSFSVFCNFQTCMSLRCPSKCGVPDALHDFLQMPTNAGKSGSTLTGEFWRGRLDGVSGTLGFPLERRVSRMLHRDDWSPATGANRTLLQRLLGGWSTRPRVAGEKHFACRDVAYTAAATLALKQTMSSEWGSDHTSFSLSQDSLLLLGDQL